MVGVAFLGENADLIPLVTGGLVDERRNSPVLRGCG